MLHSIAHPRTSAAIGRLRTAMTDIEHDIAEHQGVYPYNFGRVTQSELCRRADVKKATLQNSVHKDTTRVEIIRWLEALNSKLTQSRVGTRERVTAIADDLTAAMQRLKLENEEISRQLASAQDMIRNGRPENSQSMPPGSVHGCTELVACECQFAPGTTLRHYKGGLYRVVGACLIEATMVPGVLYQPLQGDKQAVVWMRPLTEFTDEVQTAHGLVPRFVPVTGAE